jgi:hypothetical protein
VCGPEEHTHYGYRLFDDYVQTYCNIWEKEDIKLPPLEILNKAVSELDEVAGMIIDDVIENEKGIYIGDDWFEWAVIKPILNG